MSEFDRRRPTDADLDAAMDELSPAAAADPDALSRAYERLLDEMTADASTEDAARIVAPIPLSRRRHGLASPDRGRSIKRRAVATIAVAAAAAAVIVGVSSLGTDATRSPSNSANGPKTSSQVVLELAAYVRAHPIAATADQYIKITNHYRPRSAPDVDVFYRPVNLDDRSRPWVWQSFIDGAMVFSASAKCGFVHDPCAGGGWFDATGPFLATLALMSPDEVAASLLHFARGRAGTGPPSDIALAAAIPCLQLGITNEKLTYNVLFALAGIAEIDPTMVATETSTGFLITQRLPVEDSTPAEATYSVDTTTGEVDVTGNRFGPGNGVTFTAEVVDAKKVPAAPPYGFSK